MRWHQVIILIAVQNLRGQALALVRQRLASNKHKHGFDYLYYPKLTAEMMRESKLLPAFLLPAFAGLCIYLSLWACLKIDNVC